ncbi:hypothetical protein CCO03_09050 [Comamonas serinivorans]|uniref:Phospholipase A1 n=1 Tax=Comamonas serinivorans TaxID=1082851 RepID=A0A1Y0EMH5_9BURK|nr:phospholipase A [Comamonas serinivorans]ARU04806.1 hypothetical protein CCO03_09050 [Comamonas serinivorans]
MPPSFAPATLFAVASLAGSVQAQTPTHTPSIPVIAPASASWQACTALRNDAERLSCFDGWAAQHTARTSPASAPTAASNPAATTTAAAPAAPDAPPVAITTNPDVAAVRRCNDPDQSLLSRVWELEQATDCGTFTLRGYRPNTIAVSVANSVNRQPYSPAPGHQASTERNFQKHEARLQLSLRTKLAKGMFADSPGAMDSLWFGYTQQSNWQVFNGELSRPFRTTDHEPEVMYIYPLNRALPGGWNWRFAGIGLVHQSNGQSLPLSRSWNRAYLITGLELNRQFTLQAKVWKRFNEGADKDDNPDISNYVGRGELTAAWHVNEANTLSTTLRSSFGRTTRGSAKLEWFRTIGRNLAGGPGSLRFHTAVFTGYGDSLIDYNRKRTVLTVGFSLMDF